VGGRDDWSRDERDLPDRGTGGRALSRWARRARWRLWRARRLRPVRRPTRRHRPIRRPAGATGQFGGPPGATGQFGGPPGGGAGGATAGPGGFGGDSASLQAAITYAKTHGGGTIAVESQSSAAAAILSSGADVAGIGGFSGRESSVTASWIAAEVASGQLRWVLPAASGGFGAPGDTRTGSQSAISVVEKACRADTVSGTKLYDCQGRASALLQAARTAEKANTA
jgi:hypothetical protein